MMPLQVERETEIRNLAQALASCVFSQHGNFTDKTLDAIAWEFETVLNSEDKQSALGMSLNLQDFEQALDLYCSLLLAVEGTAIDPSLVPLKALVDPQGEVEMIPPQTPLPEPSSFQAEQKKEPEGIAPSPSLDDYEPTASWTELPSEVSQAPEPAIVADIKPQEPAYISEPSAESITEEPPASSSPEKKDGLIAFSSPEAQAYLDFALPWLSGEKPDNFEMPHRMLGYALVHCLEAECVTRLSSAFQKFWPLREAAIQSLLDGDKTQFDLKDELKDLISREETQHPELQNRHQFPISACLTSLRYILAVEDPSHYEPTLLELGLFFFLFGRARDMETVRLKNFIGVEGLPEGAHSELLLRLTRLHWAKTHLTSALKVFSTEDLRVVKDDVQRILVLLGATAFGRTGAELAA